MKNKRKFSGRFTAFAVAAGMLVSSGLFSTSDTQIIQAYDKMQNGQTPEGYSYELWNQDDRGTAEMELENGFGGFSCTWKDVYDCLFGTGLKFGSVKHHSDYGRINLEYDVDYKPAGNSYLYVYGWTEDPLVEYSIVEAWSDWRPPGDANSLFQFTSDGKTYDVYKKTRFNQPSIHGTDTFEQYWSVNTINPARANSKTNLKGNVSLSEHFNAWEKAGLKLGNMYDLSLYIEGYKSSGTATVNRNVIYINGFPVVGKDKDHHEHPVTTVPAVTDPDPDPDPDPVVVIPSASHGVSADFENGFAGEWEPRGDGVVIGFTGIQKHSGSKSLVAVNRAEPWNGIQNSSSELEAGCSYDISSYITITNPAIITSDFAVGIQYDKFGETIYSDIAEVTARAGEWTMLGGQFIIPDDAENITLYIQSAYPVEDSAKNLINFYVDDITLTNLSEIHTTPVTSITVPSADEPAAESVTTAVTSPLPAEVYAGDVDGNGLVNTLDIVKLMHYMIGSEVLTPDQFKASDMNGDGKISIIDLITLKNKFI